MSFDLQNGYPDVELGALLCILVSSYIAYCSGFFCFPYKIEPLKKGLVFFHVLTVFFLFIVVQLIVVPLFFSFYEAVKTGTFFVQRSVPIGPGVQGWFGFVTILLSFTVVYGFYRIMDSEARNLLWERGESLGKLHALKSFLVGCSVWLLSYPVIVLIGHLLGLLVHAWTGIPETDQVAVKWVKATSKFPALYGSLVIGMAFIVPLVEELLFRGFLQTWLRGQLGIPYSIFITSLVFACFHYSPSQGVSNIQYITVLWILSCFLGFLYERERSLWAPIGLHMTFNTISLLMLYDSGTA